MKRINAPQGAGAILRIDIMDNENKLMLGYEHGFYVIDPNSLEVELKHIQNEANFGAISYVNNLKLFCLGGDAPQDEKEDEKVKKEDEKVKL